MGEGRILWLCRGCGEGLIEVVVGEYGVEGALLLLLLLIFIICLQSIYKSLFLFIVLLLTIPI